MAGVEVPLEAASILVVVGILPFSTAVDVAAVRGAVVHPFSDGDRIATEAAAEQANAALAQPRKTASGQLSLSPASLQTIHSLTNLMLPSPQWRETVHCFSRQTCLDRVPAPRGCRGLVSVILDGERWLDGSLRPAVDELLGAGAMIHHLTWHCSPEAQVARDAFRSAAHDLTRSIRDSISGRKLVGRGFLRGVDMALEVDVNECAPLLRNDACRAT